MIQKENSYNNKEDDEFIAKYTKNLYEEMHNIKEYNSEKELMDECQESNKKLFIHFYSDEFEKCKLYNLILNDIKDHFKDILFRKINVKICYTTVEKLGIKVLPFTCLFRDGYFIESIEGFRKFGNKEDINSNDVIRYIEGCDLSKEIF